MAYKKRKNIGYILLRDWVAYHVLSYKAIAQIAENGSLAFIVASSRTIPLCPLRIPYAVVTWGLLRLRIG